MKKKDKKSKSKNFEVPIEGSLGLLALGHVGLKAWRNKRIELETKNKNESEK